MRPEVGRSYTFPAQKVNSSGASGESQNSLEKVSLGMVTVERQHEAQLLN
jgi:hypothetical protein